MDDIRLVDDDVAGQDLQSTVLEGRRIRFGQKTDRPPLGSARDGADCWRGCTKILHPEPVGTDLRDLDLKSILRCWQYLDVGS
ncbi:hypothetical protein AXW67_17450 [Bradyrhizobium neotropicale]|uniref:Uncharacterized protein n=1 Tax=Bradyrhizobium neotropicale TaxID=1497615 RepID=A0A176Z219_9BRAD|nr:hypothetical protein AXW67_17450 [Bradyrhizobium neotropicale]